MILQLFGGRGASSGRKSGGSRVPVAKTIEEANKLAVDLGLAKQANFSGIHIEHANMIIQELAAAKKEFPQIAKLSYIGNSVDGGYPKWKSGVAGVACGKIYGDTFVSALIFNKSDFGIESFSKNYLEHMREMVKDGFHPKGCDTHRYYVIHEIGHILDFNYKGDLSKTSKIRSLFKSSGGKNIDKMSEVLSGYAATNAKEFLAEAWAEYRCNPNPRPVACEVGKIIEEAYKGKGA